MFVLVLLFILVPLVEIAVIIKVGEAIGFLETIALLLVISIAGAWIVKQQGLGVLRRIVAERRQGRMPAATVVDGVLILVAGALLLTPGFVTDAAGLALLLPPVRKGVRKLLGQRWRARRSPRRYGIQYGPSQQESRHPHSGQR